MTTKYHYRITWIDGVPHLQCCPVEVVLYSAPDGYRTRPGTYAEDGKILHPATETEIKAMYTGGLSHDSETEPGRLAWANHVANGGD